MSLLTTIRTKFQRSASRTATSPAADVAAPVYPAVEWRPATAIAAVYRCVKLLSETVAVMPIDYLRRRDGILERVDDRELDYVLNVEPDPVMTAYEMRRQIVIELLLRGNAYIVPQWNVEGELERLVLCSRGSVAHNELTDTYVVNDAVMGLRGVFPENEVIHLKGLTLRNPKRGESVIGYARQALNIAHSADEETYKRFANGGRVRGIISNDKSSVRGYGKVQDKQLAALAEDISEKLQRQDVVSTPYEADFKQLGMTSADMQFLESRKFTVAEICRFFGVHPAFCFADNQGNYKSVEQASLDYLSKTLNPILRGIEEELRRKLVPRNVAHRYEFRFDRRALHSADLDTMMRYRQGLLQSGATVNEVRMHFDLPRVEGGDEVMVSANLKPLKELLDIKENQ